MQHVCRTHFIFQRADRAYYRVIILSVMQGWVVHQSSVETFRCWYHVRRSIPEAAHFLFPPPHHP